MSENGCEFCGGRAMTDKLLPCPFCGGKAAVWDKSRYDTCVRCDGCNAQTDWLPTISDAIAAWNRRAELGNKPLTLDELRQMDGEPVWVELTAVNDGYWDIHLHTDDDTGDYESLLRVPLKNRYYGKTWLAYRSKPKEEHHEDD